MAPRKDITPSVATFADHEVITPPHELRKAVSLASDDDDPVARAEAALAQLSAEFPSWMEAECERLEAARRDVHREGLTKQPHDGLFRAAHDIKGEAATFGYPAIGAVASSLCRLIEHTPEMTHIPVALVDQHVDAVRAIAREHGRAHRAEVADALSRRLREVTDEFLRKANHHRPEYLAGIFASSLAPPLAGG